MNPDEPTANQRKCLLLVLRICLHHLRFTPLSPSSLHRVVIKLICIKLNDKADKIRLFKGQGSALCALGNPCGQAAFLPWQRKQLRHKVKLHSFLPLCRRGASGCVRQLSVPAAVGRRVSDGEGRVTSGTPPGSGCQLLPRLIYFIYLLTSACI